MTRVNRTLDPERNGSQGSELETRLRGMVIGQDAAIRQIVDVYQTFVAGLASPGRPVGNFLFLGPTGSGKTRLVEATAEALVGDVRAAIKIDCAEFQHSHEIAKLIGSPPGYLGHRETHPALTQERLNQYHTEKLKLSFVLFDEIEKASDALWKLMLGIMDKGVLTLGDNRQVDFSQTLIFMTSNLGAREMAEISGSGIGFTPKAPVAADVNDRIERAAIEAARRKFPPEFMNRIDKTAVFHPLNGVELMRILDLELASLQRRVAEATPFAFSLSSDAKGFLLEEGTDVRYGARHLKRAIERLLVHPLSNLVASQQISAGDLIRVEFDSGSRRLVFRAEAEQMTVAEFAEMGVPAIGEKRQAAGAVAMPCAAPIAA